MGVLCLVDSHRITVFAAVCRSFCFELAGLAKEQRGVLHALSGNSEEVPVDSELLKGLKEGLMQVEISER